MTKSIIKNLFLTGMLLSTSLSAVFTVEATAKETVYISNTINKHTQFINHIKKQYIDDETLPSLERKHVNYSTTTYYKQLSAKKIKKQDVVLKPEQTETANSSIPIQGTIPNVKPLLVNKDYPLPSTYKPDNLVIPNVSFASPGNIEKNYLSSTVKKPLEDMFHEAIKEGIFLSAVSGYRSFDRQTVIYNNNVKSKGEAATARVSAKPGQSEHQTGLAMDISSSSNNFNLNTKFANTKEGIWLKNNAHKYGFILRYPKGKEDITKYSYEPWHYRFVGTEVATFIFNNNLTLEEYILLIEKTRS